MVQEVLPLEFPHQPEPKVHVTDHHTEPVMDQSIEIDEQVAEVEDPETIPEFEPPIKPKSSRKWTLLTFLSASQLVLVILLVIIAATIWQGPDAILSMRAAPWGDPIEVNIPRGTGLKEAGRLLKEAGVIGSSYAFMIAAFLTSKDGNIKAGEYAISPAVSLKEVLLILRRGRVIAYNIPIPEGFTLKQIIDRLAANGLVNRSAAWAVARDPAYLASHEIPGDNLEGYLFPNTYKFSRGLSAETIFDTMIEQFWKVWQPLKPLAQKKGLSKQEAVTLASIIEREAVRDSERPLVSSVYHNRLKRDMRLQADPTVIYGIKNFRGKLTRAHLKRDTPYNTYTRKGLPPGPICSPGAKSLKAAVAPKNTKNLYFVAKGNGYHAFARTLREHNRNVWRYQRRR